MLVAALGPKADVFTVEESQMRMPDTRRVEADAVRPLLSIVGPAGAGKRSLSRTPASGAQPPRSATALVIDSLKGGQLLDAMENGSSIVDGGGSEGEFAVNGVAHGVAVAEW